MKKEGTDEFSFVLKPGKEGVGVFATHDIKEGIYLRLFGNENGSWDNARILEKGKVPETLRDYCMARGETMICPKDFGQMQIGWYVNHSDIPNVYHKDYHWYAARNIKAGEEILADYNTLEEPPEARPKYYKS